MRLPMRAIFVALAATLTAECSRTPAEEFPATATTATQAASVTAVAPPVVAPAASSAVVSSGVAPAPAIPPGRCVLPTPASAPPAVPSGPAPGCPPDPEGNQRVPVVNIGFPDVGPLSIEAELVSTEHDTMRGLMYRKAMPEEHGMLFDLRSREDHKFWMHNTCIALDLFYIDGDGLLVGIVENAPTLDDAPRGVGCPSRYVLETNAGWARRHGVKAGQHVALPRPPDAAH
jgi:uncharacterized membrane protein (UPF0127 family)